MNNRFQNWKRPKIKHDKLTKWNWFVLYPENLILGERVDIGAFTLLNAKAGIIIEDEVQIGSHVSLNSASTIDKKEGKIIIGRGACISSHCVVMPDIIIGAGAIIGANSFVNHNIGEGEMAWGTPCKKTENEIILLEAMQKLEIKDGDIVVFKSQKILSQIAINNIKNSMAKIFKDLALQCKSIILEEGMDIGVISKRNKE